MNWSAVSFMELAKDYPLKDLTGEIIAAGIEVHRNLGPGFVEKLYHKALTKEIKSRGLKADTGKRCDLVYKGTGIGYQEIDLIVEGKVVVELKAVKEISSLHVSQVVSYLKALNLNVGLVLNFGRIRLEIKRVIL